MPVEIVPLLPFSTGFLVMPDPVGFLAALAVFVVGAALVLASLFVLVHVCFSLAGAFRGAG